MYQILVASATHGLPLLLLLLLSCFSHVRLCATPETAAHQAPPSLGFSRQEHWSGLHFQCMKVKSESEVIQSYPTLRDPMDCSLPGSSVHRILQARVLEWGAIAFSMAYLTLALFEYYKNDSFSYLPFQVDLHFLGLKSKITVGSPCQ